MSDQPENPYAPPAAASAAWDPTTDSPSEQPVIPTAIPKVFGVLSIVFGGLMLLGGLLGSCTGFLGQSFSQLGTLGTAGTQQAETVRIMMKHVGAIYRVIGYQSLIFAMMSGWLLAIGIGQLRYRRWAQRWTMYWGGLALVVLVGMILMSILWIGPAYSAMFQEIQKVSPSGTMPAQFSSGLSTLLGGTSGVMTTVFYAPYPILLLVFFTRDRVRAAMFK